MAANQDRTPPPAAARPGAYEFEAPQYYDFAGPTPPGPPSESSSAWFERQPASSPLHSDEGGADAVGDGGVRDTQQRTPERAGSVDRLSLSVTRTPHTPGRRSMLGMSVVSTKDLVDVADADALASTALSQSAEVALSHEPNPFEYREAPPLPPAPQPRSAEPSADTPSPARAPNVDAMGRGDAAAPMPRAMDERQAHPPSLQSTPDRENAGASTKRRVIGGTPLAMRTLPGVPLRADASPRDADAVQRLEIPQEHGAQSVGGKENTAAPSTTPPRPMPRKGIDGAAKDLAHLAIDPAQSPRRASPRGVFSLGLCQLGGGEHAHAAAQPAHRVVPNEPKLGQLRTPDRLRLERLRTAAPLLPARSTKPLTVPSEFSFATAHRQHTRSSGALPQQRPVAAFRSAGHIRPAADAPPATRPLHSSRQLTVPVSPMLMTRARATSHSGEHVGAARTTPVAAPPEPQRQQPQRRVPMHAIRVPASSKDAPSSLHSPAARKLAPMPPRPAAADARPVDAAAGPARVRSALVFPPPPRSSVPLTVPVSPQLSCARRVRSAPQQ